MEFGIAKGDKLKLTNDWGKQAIIVEVINANTQIMLRSGPIVKVIKLSKDYSGLRKVNEKFPLSVRDINKNISYNEPPIRKKRCYYIYHAETDNANVLATTSIKEYKTLEEAWKRDLVTYLLDYNPKTYASIDKWKSDFKRYPTTMDELKDENGILKEEVKERLRPRTTFTVARNTDWLVGIARDKKVAADAIDYWTKYRNKK